MEPPHLFDLLVLLLAHECLRWHERAVRPWPALTALALLLAVWARFQGEMLAGLILLAAYCTGAAVEFLRAGTAAARHAAKAKTFRLGGVGLFCVGAAGLHPAGWLQLCENIRLLFRALPRDWPGGYNTVDFQSVAARGLLVWLAAVLLDLVWRRPRLTPGAGLVLVSWIGMAGYAQRYLPVMVILTVPLLAASAGRKWGWAWVGLAVAVLLAGLPGAPGPGPDRAVQFIRAQPAERGRLIFIHHTWNEYLAQAWPAQPRFIASPDSIREYQQIANLGPNWRKLLDRRAVAWTVLPCRHCLNQGLRELANWRCAYSDDVAVVYRRVP